MWGWLNYELVAERLRTADEEVVASVLDALESIAVNPFDPAGVETHPLRGVNDMPDTRVAWLPGGFFLTYRPYLQGPIPHRGRNIVVKSFRDYSELSDALLE